MSNKETVGFMLACLIAAVLFVSCVAMIQNRINKDEAETHAYWLKTDDGKETELRSFSNHGLLIRCVTADGREFYVPAIKIIAIEKVTKVEEKKQ